MIETLHWCAYIVIPLFLILVGIVLHWVMSGKSP